jgi:hypothetical protein
MGSGQRQAGLMFDGAQRPFVGLRVDPMARVRQQPLKRADVLDHCVFLVLGFLEQEAIALDRRRRIAPLGRWLAEFLAGGRKTAKCEEEKGSKGQ